MLLSVRRQDGRCPSAAPAAFDTHLAKTTSSHCFRYWCPLAKTSKTAVANVARTLVVSSRHLSCYYHRHQKRFLTGRRLGRDGRGAAKPLATLAVESRPTAEMMIKQFFSSKRKWEKKISSSFLLYSLCLCGCIHDFKIEIKSRRGKTTMGNIWGKCYLLLTRAGGPPLLRTPQTHPLTTQ